MRELIVYLGTGRVGELVRKDNGNLQFRYDGKYPGPPISQSMPVQEAAHPHRICLAVFGGLLLEGESREAAARNLGVSTRNDFALLEAFGGDCAGALRFWSLAGWRRQPRWSSGWMRPLLTN
jgi:serine/threonine-protein kinase HipA